MWETFGMNPWIALGLFLVGAGLGSLASAALHAKEARKLKNLLKAASNNSQTEDKERSHKTGRAQSA